MALDINALKSKLNSFKRTGGGDRDTSIWKPKEGKTVIRIVPWKDNPENPFIELYFHYLGNKTHLSPLSYGNRDPIAEFADALRSDQSRDPKERYAEARPFMPKLRTYIPVIVRGEEDKGVQLWELNGKLVKDIYSVLAHPDYKDENLMDPETGYDFTVTVSPTDKTFAGNPVKDIKLQPRRKPSPLAKSSEAADKIIAGIPNLEAYFKAQVKSEDELNAMLQNFLAGNGSSSEETEEVEEVKDKTVSEAKVKKAKKSIDDAFGDL